MQQKRLEVGITAILHLSTTINVREKSSALKEQLLVEVTHLSVDILHRYMRNMEIFGGDVDWYLVGLTCFYISSKLNSFHFGGADFIPDFYYTRKSKYI